MAVAMATRSEAVLFADTASPGVDTDAMLVAAGAAVRVTPTLYNTHQELDRLVAALRAESQAFR